MNLHRLLVNSGKLLTGSTCLAVSTFASNAMMARGLGVEIFGIFVLCLSFSELSLRLLYPRSWQAFIKFSVDQPVKFQKGLLVYCFIFELIALCVALCAGMLVSETFLISFSIPEKYDFALTILLLLTFFQLLSDFTIGIFRRFDSYQEHVKVLYLHAFIKIVAVGLAFLNDVTMEGYIFALLGVSVIIAVVKLILSLRVLSTFWTNCLGLRMGFVLMHQVRNLPEIAPTNFILWSMMNSGVRLLPRQIDNFAIGFLLGSQSVGIYKVAKEFANMLGKLIDPLYQLAFPDLSQKINRSDHEMRMLYLRNLSLIGLALGLTFLFLSVFVGEFAIETLYGLDFSKAYVPMLILIFAQLLSSVTVGFYAMQLAFGRARAAFTNQLISVVIYSLLLLPLVDTMGISGGALCYIFYYVAASCLVIFDVRNFSKRYA